MRYAVFDELKYLEADVFFEFPNTEGTKGNFICFNGNLSPGMLLSGYKQGFFPWYESDEQGIRWYNPEPRFVLLPQEFHLPKSLEKEIKRNEKHLESNEPNAIIFKSDTAFRTVIENCAWMKRADQDGTWITPNMIEAYCRLNELGFAHSIEAWQTIDGTERLVGGFYGVRLENAFFGESMFTKISGATKIVFAKFAKDFFAEGGKFIDCQAYTDNMARYGAKNSSRTAYLRLLTDTLE